MGKGREETGIRAGRNKVMKAMAVPSFEKYISENPAPRRQAPPPEEVAVMLMYYGRVPISHIEPEVHRCAQTIRKTCRDYGVVEDTPEQDRIDTIKDKLGIDWK